MADINKLEAFEWWIYRRVLKIPWTNRVMNNEVLHRMNTDRALLTTINRKKTSYLSQNMRNHKYEFFQLTIQGKIERRRGIDRKQFS